ncbi:hypothetical protein [Actomonas aquatica]|uniref:Small CPxCG-related zinc finger protein n=1 Tax=Actomonas aquatica TaxID=2866162 RepID=A0ABZ1C4S3_9BACT|nr:hypothetical protein [Opitutus sp. WL0086]WRQ86360.1 hypothetical protein K1X11_016210 [Opitutus sp. WL0086]
MSEHTLEPDPAPAPCVHCGIPVTTRIADLPVCDACYTVRGACCQEFGEED